MLHWKGASAEKQMTTNALIAQVESWNIGAGGFSWWQILTTAIGSFLGAISAFGLEAWRRRHQRADRRKEAIESRDDRRFEALLSAQSVLLAQQNSLAAFLAQFPTGANPFDNLKHILVGFSKHSLDFAGLGFLGESDEVQLIIDLDVADASYRMAVDTAALRNRLLDDFFKHPETEIVDFDEASGAVRARGNRIVLRNLRQSNEATFTAMNRALARNAETSQKLAAFAIRNFPAKKRFPFIPSASAEGAKPNQSS